MFFCRGLLSAVFVGMVFYHGQHVSSSSYRPLEITTEEFSKKWGTFTYEKKLKVQYSMSKPEEFMEAVKSKLNFHLIQIIGKFFFTELRSWNIEYSLSPSLLPSPSSLSLFPSSFRQRSDSWW